MSRVSFYLDKKGAGEDSPIFVAVRYAGKRIKAYTGRKIDQDQWNVKKGRANPKKFKNDPVAFNAFLQVIDNACETHLNGNKPLSKVDLKGIIAEANGVKPDRGFFAYAEEFLRTAKMAPNTSKGFRTTLNHLRAFRPDITFQDIDMTFYRLYTAYLRDDLGLGENTIGDNIKRIKRIMGAAHDEDIHENLNFKKKAFKTPSISNDEVYLSAEEMMSLYKADLKPQLAKFRDAFLLHCAFGIRYEDGIQIAPDNFKTEGNETFLSMVQGKTGTTVKIPLMYHEFKFLKPLLKKYKNIHPCLRKGKLPSVQKFNQYLREGCVASQTLDQVVQLSINGERISKIKHECIKSHSARRSFSTLLYVEEYPVQLIMAATGHRKESTFLKYVRADQLTLATKLAQHKKQRKHKRGKVVKLKVA